MTTAMGMDLPGGLDGADGGVAISHLIRLINCKSLLRVGAVKRRVDRSFQKADFAGHYEDHSAKPTFDY
jgi:hypothetical protein